MNLFASLFCPARDEPATIPGWSELRAAIESLEFLRSFLFRMPPVSTSKRNPYFRQA